MIDLVVSIVNHKNRVLLEPLLESILAHTRTISYEICVVDNAPGDGSAEMVRAKFPSVHLLCNETPNGFAVNHNQVLHQRQGRHYILLNDDMLLSNDALDRMVAFMDVNPDVGAVGCKLLNPDGTLQRSCWRGYPSPKTLLIDLFYLSKWLPRLYWVRDFEATLHSANEPTKVDYLLGACLMVRRQVLDQVGMLDEKFFMFLEETDWCYRIQKNGWRIFWVPDGEIIHYGQQSVGKSPERFLPMLYSNYYRFCQKHGTSRSDLLALKGVILTGISLRAALWTYRRLKGHPAGRAMVGGYLRTLRVTLAL